MNEPNEGGCLCGAVRYRAAGEAVATSLCHCRSCRLAAGAPSVAWAIFRAADFAYTAGAPVCFESSPGVVRTFCGRCGTSLTYEGDARNHLVDVTTISLDHPELFPPEREIWIEHQLSWETLNGSLPHYARSSVGASPVD